MTKKIKKILISTGIIIALIIGIILYLKWGLIPTIAFFGTLLTGGGVLAGNRKTYKEVNNILTDMEAKNDKINNGDHDAISDAYDSIGGSESKRNRNN